MRSNLDSCVYARGCSATNHQWNLTLTEIIITLHLLSNISHFFKRRCDQARQSNNIGILFFGAFQNLGTRNHHTHIGNFKVITLQDDSHNIFTNIVHIAFYSSHHDFAFSFGFAPTSNVQAFFFLDIGNQNCNRLLHYARTFYHLRQEHLALTK